MVVKTEIIFDTDLNIIVCLLLQPNVSEEVIYVNLGCKVFKIFS